MSSTRVSSKKSTIVRFIAVCVAGFALAACSHVTSRTTTASHCAAEQTLICERFAAERTCVCASTARTMRQLPSFAEFL